MSSLSYFIASRYTLARGKSYLLAFISRVSIIGLVLAVSVLITVLSVMNGFDKALKEQILAFMPHATLTAYGAITDWPEKVSEAENFSAVSHAEPFSFSQALVSQADHVQAAWIYGIDADYQADNSVLVQRLGKEKLKQLEQGKQMVMGKNLADKLQLSTGDSVRVLIASADGKSLPYADFFQIIAILHTGTELDQRLLLLDRRQLALLNNRPANSVDGVRVQVHDLFAARPIAYYLADQLDLPRVQDWSQTHGNLYQAIQMSRKMVVLLVLIIIGVAAFNVVSTLVLAVNDKSSDIAILRTMGASNRQIMRLFIWQGSMIGGIGVFWGVLIGVGLSLTVGDLLQMLEGALQAEILSSNIYPVDYLPSEVQLSDVVIVASSAFLLSILASLFPAWQASRLDPARILRYE